MTLSEAEEFSLTQGHSTWPYMTFLLVFHCNYVSILHQFRDIINYFPKFKEVTWLWPHLVEGVFVNLKANTSSLNRPSDILWGQKV